MTLAPRVLSSKIIHPTKDRVKEYGGSSTGIGG